MSHLVLAELVELVTAPPGVVTETVSDIAPAGTVATIHCPDVTVNDEQGTPLNATDVPRYSSRP
ncbi:MAG: hypothetical protein ABIY70_27480 [Capsulimonas sp.]|uniref:hypothetical protein n=1 Tax=Capsulimonas sp. TaxID=2494211 RepID=UPI003266D9C9